MRHNENGSILIITLIVLSLMTVVALSLSKYSFFDYSRAKLSALHIKAKVQIESAKNAFNQLISKDFILDPTKFDALRDNWEKLSANYLEEEIHTQIRDINATYPFNTLIEPAYSESNQKEMEDIFIRLLVILLQEHGVQGTEQSLKGKAENILNSIYEWCGVLPLSPKSLDWYLSQNPSYLPPKTKLGHPEELGLIYYDEFDKTNSNQSLKHNFLYGSDTKAGLISLINTFSMGPLNISTAHPYLLEALPQNAENKKPFRRKIEQTRQNLSATQKEEWYQNIFQQYREESPSRQILTDKTRQISLEIQLGNRDFHVKYLGFGMLSSKKVNWYYQKIQ